MLQGGNVTTCICNEDLCNSPCTMCESCEEEETTTTTTTTSTTTTASTNPTSTSSSQPTTSTTAGSGAAYASPLALYAIFFAIMFYWCIVVASFWSPIKDSITQPYNAIKISLERARKVLQRSTKLFKWSSTYSERNNIDFTQPGRNNFGGIIQKYLPRFQ